MDRELLNEFSSDLALVADYAIMATFAYRVCDHQRRIDAKICRDLAEKCSTYALEGIANACADAIEGKT